MISLRQTLSFNRLLPLAMVVLWMALPFQLYGQENSTHQPLSTKQLFEEQILPFIEDYCLDCHSGEDGEGEVDLDRFMSHVDVDGDLETWSHVLQVLERGEMPPEGADQPSDEIVKAVQDWILRSIAESDQTNMPLGRLRRLNRVQYENTIRDLFRLSRDCFNNPSRMVQTTDYFQPATGKMPRAVLAVSCFYNGHRRHSDLVGISNLPVDPPVEHGFANDQEALSLSPLLLESYFELASSLLDSQEFSQISAQYQTMFLANDSASKSELRVKAHEKIKAFLPRAFRSDVLPVEAKVYTDLFDAEFAENKAYTESMKTTISAALVSPRFLFRREFLAEDPTVQTRRDVELDRNYAMASRLSYFLWGSMPDDELFRSAREKRLTQPAELIRQVNRMMDDRKIKSLATDFGMQWLKVDKVLSTAPDKSYYKNYYQRKMPPPALSMGIEQLLFFETIMVENRSILEFVHSKFGYLNRQLMEWYQLDISKSVAYAGKHEDFEDFFRVQWNNDYRGGVITSGATLLSTSTTTRTSPVYRGAWVLDVMFNAPPKPAPANVEPLETDDGQEGKFVNVRDKLEQHRDDPACASCHAQIDPPGFALEKFDAVGRWRQEYETGAAINSSGKLDGVEFEGPAGFKNAILQNQSRFAKAFVEHAMKYALGRQLHYADQPEIRRITGNLRVEDFRFRAVIRQIVLSEMFQRFDKKPDANSASRTSNILR